MGSAHSPSRVRARLRTLAGLTAAGLAAASITTVATSGVAHAAATFTVTSTSTTGDANPGNGICATSGAVCTLRAALEEANALAGVDTINFNLASGRIAPTAAAPLPTITEAVNINGVGSPAIPRVDAYNSGSPLSYGLEFGPGSGGSTVRGLEVVRAGSAGIALFSDGNTVAGNYIGTTSTSSVTCTGGSTTNCGSYYGIYVLDGSNNTIGGTVAADRNIISNNPGYGVIIAGSVGTADGNVVRGNYIGTNVGGTAALGNGYGISVTNSGASPSNTTVTGNVISGNTSYGLAFEAGSGTVTGNLIGTNAAGTAAVANVYVGAYLGGASHDVTVGGATAADRNIISGNGGSGLDVYGDSATTDNITIKGNYVGLNAAGTAMISNGNNAIAVNPTNGLLIDGNTVAGTAGGWYAISVTGCVSCSPAWGVGAVVQNNTVGLAIDGTTALGANYGIYLSSTADSSVLNNTITGSIGDGIAVAGSYRTTVSGNRAGTDITGELDRGNAGSGISLSNDTETTVSNNVISGNASYGLTVNGSSESVITGNHIGTDDDGQTALPNDYYGVYLTGSDGEAIGAVGAGNVISGNGYEGVYLGSDSDDTTILANKIGVGDDGVVSIPNGTAGGSSGIYIDSSSERTTIGGLGAGEGNIIANNAADGININSDRNIVRANAIRNNGDLGIDLGSDGVTANDAGDGDVGPNRLQNFPVLTSVASTGSGTQVKGTLNSSASRIYRLDFYASSACDGSGNGEGATYLGYKQVTTDGTGNVTFTADLATPAAAGQAITATATDSAGRTSEFSACVTNGTIPTVSVTPASTSVGESAGTVNLNVTLSSAPTLTPVTVTWSTTDGSATSADYTPQAPAVLTYGVGETTKPISVPITTDTLDEDNETFTINLSGADNTLIATGTSTVTITDDDAPPTISVADAANVAETGGTQTFAVSLSTASSKTVTVQAATQSGTATGGSDYVSNAQTLTFAPGVTTQNVVVTINDDGTDEADESYTVELYNPVNGTIADGSGSGTIVDDEVWPTVSITPSPTTVGETGSANFNVNLSAASAQTVTVTWQTANGTAVGGSDFTTQAPTVLTYTPGQTTKPISVPISTDSLDEDDETFTVSLSAPGNAYMGTATSTVTITDDDAAPTMSIADAANVAENGGVQSFTVSLSAASGKSVTVIAATNSGTATGGADYTTAGTLVTFPPGSTSQNVSVTVLDDLIDESDESYTVNLFGASNATIVDGSGSGTIVDDDTWPTITVSPGSTSTAESGSVNLTVDLSAPSTQTVTVTWQTTDGTAIGGSDFTTQAPTVLTFTPGQTSKPISVPITTDPIDEEDETFAVRLTAPGNGLLGGGSSSTVTITDDDAAPTVTVANAGNVTEQVGLPTNQNFTITLSTPSAKTVTLGVGTTNVTAVAGADYTAGGGVVTFTPGQTSKIVTIVTLDDIIDEFNQTYTLDVFTVTNATIADGSGQGQIIDNDATPTVSISDGTLVEGNSGTTKMAFTITTSAPSEKVTRFDFSTSPGTAATPSDYNSRVGARIEVPLTTTSKVEYVTIKGDTNVEANETFNVDLTNPLNLTIADGHADATITNDD